MSAYQQLGLVDELIAATNEAFAFPEHASIMTLLGDGSTERNYVIQSSAPSVRRARRSWVLVPTADMHTIRGYATTKSEVTLTEEDATTRSVVVMDFAATQRFVGYWDISATLVETADPDTSGS